MNKNNPLSKLMKVGNRYGEIKLKGKEFVDRVTGETIKLPGDNYKVLYYLTLMVNIML